MSGTPNITIINLHKKYNSFCNELKTPKANDIVMQNQGNLSKQHEENNYKILISNDYDELHCEIDHYKTLSNHNEWFLKRTKKFTDEEKHSYKAQ